MTQKLIIDISPQMAIEITGDRPQDLIKEAEFWSSIPKACPVCGSSLTFTYRTPRTFKYYGLICSGSPAHKVNFGEQMESNGGGLYYKADAWEEAQFGNHNSGPSSGSGGPTAGAEQQHRNLNRDIRETWKELRGNQSLNDALGKRFGRNDLDLLTIEEKEGILASLQQSI